MESICRQVGKSQVMNLAESQEWFQTQCCGRMGLYQSIPDEQLFFIMQENEFLFEDHAPDPVYQDNVLVHFKVDDVLMASRFIDPRITVNTQVESLVVLNQCFIQ